MKSLIFCMVLVSIMVNTQAQFKTWSKEEQNKLIDAAKPCVKQTGVKMESIEEIKENNKFVDDPNLKAHLECLAIRLNLIKKDGTVNREEFKRKLVLTNNPAKTEKILEICVDKRDKAEKSLIRCAQEQDPTFRPAA